MTTIEVQVEPAEVGFDAGRLSRIDDHFRALRRRRPPGRLAGRWSPGGADRPPVAPTGHRDLEAGLPMERDTIFRMYSMTKPITSVAAMMLYEEGAFELKDPV